MIQRRCVFILLALLFTGLPVGRGGAADAEGSSDRLTVMAWNIWRGGREDGEMVGPRRVVEVVRESGADIVALQETYGSGEAIAAGLGFHFAPRDRNVSILSRYPVVEDVSVHEPFMCVGAIIELPDDSRAAVYSIWLPYAEEIWEAGTRDVTKPDTMLAACAPSAEHLAAIHSAIKTRLADEKYKDLPIIIAGDFNSMSHLDYGEVGIDQYGVAIDWPTSHILMDDGYIDTYRACNPRIDRQRDSTWTPRFPEQEQDRIDFIYLKSQRWKPAKSIVIREHDEQFPSDHAAVVTTLERSAVDPPAATRIRAVSYNIKHGRGMDDAVNLERATTVLRDLRADFIGLQEVDLEVGRSGKRNQVNDLAQSLDMHPAYGSFMPLQGGRYGMAILSRHPIVNVTSFRLPEGNEPRIALMVEARLPDGRTVVVVNVHFDWVDDDRFRFKQASALADHLRTLKQAYILLGDFNDKPRSRTIALFEEFAHEVDKPDDNRLTYPSDQPTMEIDYIWCAPAAAWTTTHTRVVDEPQASDHRPIVADLVLRAPE